MLRLQDWDAASGAVLVRVPAAFGFVLRGERDGSGPRSSLPLQRHQRSGLGRPAPAHRRQGRRVPLQPKRVVGRVFGAQGRGPVECSSLQRARGRQRAAGAPLRRQRRQHPAGRGAGPRRAPFECDVSVTSSNQSRFSTKSFIG